ncbi:MAG: glucose-1-phosphate adenylyltransferase subunit GlgD, partial [Streptococcus sp.]|nr:glucose-1-phosphate adenylyltransferase subunit GlgD [Streptococcus sp.]
SILDIDESDKVLKHELFQGGDKEVYNMSIDIFVVDTPFLIEKLEEEAAKEEPRKLRYVLRDLAVAENAFAYEHTGYLSNIHSVKAYFDANLDMLESQKFYSLFAPNQKVYTKVKNEEPTYYADSSEVKVSQFASGSIVRGKVENSVISRNVYLSEGSSVNHSIIFPRVKVAKGATVKYAIVDKDVEIAEGVTIRGTENNPVVIKKGSVVTEDIVR